jgi:hypothetical protein
LGNWLRRIRGVIGTGVTWAVGWVAVTGAFLGLGGSWDLFLASALQTAMTGFIIGSSFAVILSVAERRSHFGDLSLWGVAGCGWIAGFFVAGIGGTLNGLSGWLSELFVALMVGLQAGVFGLATFAIARRGTPELADESDDQVPRIEGGG